MNKKRAGREMIESFLRMVNSYNAMEKHTIRYGTSHKFHHSERHALDVFGHNPLLNITQFAELTGVTKGAISQLASKLEKKGAIRRYKDSANEKEVLIELTEKGREICRHHQKTNEETIELFHEELKKHSEDKVAFAVHLFKWLEEYLAQSRENMEKHKH